MIWRVILLLFLSGIAALDEDGYACIRHFDIYPPDNLNEPVYFPSYWNDSQPPALFGLHQHCQWLVSVPEGLYATAVFYKDAVEATVYLNYANNEAEELVNNDHAPFMLTAPMFQVDLFKSNTAGAFSFKIIWSKYPKADKKSVTLKKGGLPIAGIPDPYLTTYQAETYVSFVAFGLKNESRNALLRQSAVYDGNSTSGLFMGNLFKLMMEGKEVITRGSTLTVYTFGLYEEFNYTLFMVQDHSNDPGHPRYQGVNCISDSQCLITLNARFGETAVATADNQPEYITGFYSFPEYSTLKIYEGMISETTLVATLNKNNYWNWLPMKLKMTMRNYVVDSGNVTFSISRDPSIVNWNTMYDGRKVFAQSSFYGFLSDQQDVNETFTTTNSQKLFFNYIVTAADFAGSQTNLTVTIFSNGNLILSETYDSSNPPPKSVWSMRGDKFEVVYQTNGISTKGCRIDFSTTLSGNDTITSTHPTSTIKSTTILTTHSSRTSTHPTSHTSTTSPKISTTATSSTMTTSTQMLSHSTNYNNFNNATTKSSTVHTTPTTPTTPTTYLTTSTQMKMTSTQSTTRSSTRLSSTTSRTSTSVSSTLITSTPPTKRQSAITATGTRGSFTTPYSSYSRFSTTSIQTSKAHEKTKITQMPFTTTVRIDITTKNSPSPCTILIITGSILLVIS